MKRFLILLSLLFCNTVCADTINLHWLNEDGTVYENSTCVIDSDLILPSTPPTKYGYTFTGWKMSNYTPIEYIESTGAQYIDTGILTSSNLMSEYKFKLTVVHNSIKLIFGASRGSRSDYPTDTQLWEEAGTINVANCGNTKCSITLPDTNIHTIIFNDYSGKILFDNIDKGSFLPYAANNKVIYIGTSNHPSKNSLGGAPQKIYTAKFINKTTNTVIMELMPALDKDNVPCMVDKVTGQFFYNQGTGQFIAGPAL